MRYRALASGEAPEARNALTPLTTSRTHQRRSRTLLLHSSTQPTARYAIRNAGAINVAASLIF
jgi:hypothetical protein